MKTGKNGIVALLLAVGMISNGQTLCAANNSKVVLYQQDAKELVDTVERTYPDFIDGDIPKGYEQAKKDYLEQSSKKVTIEDFKNLTRAYLTSLEDAHTTILDGEMYTLDIDFVASKDTLYLVDDQGRQTDSKVIKIGNVTVEDLFKWMDKHYPAENQIARDYMHADVIKGQLLLKAAGCKVEQDVTIQIENQGKVSEKKVQFIKYHNEGETQQYEKGIDTQLMGDILYIDLNTCMLNKEEFDIQMENIKKSMKEGVTKYIIDVRDNTGGDATFCRTMLEEMGMKYPEFGYTFRNSLLTVEQRGTEKSEGLEKEDSILTAVPNKDIQLAVLTNEKTFSAATMLATYVKDGKLGTIIGRISSNAPSFSADTVYYTMKQSKIVVSISTSILLRPDTKADQTMLVPDIMTEPGEDSLQRAIKYLNEKK